MLPIIFLDLVDEEDLPDFEKLYNEQKMRAYKIAFSLLKNESLAEDCVSEAFLSIAKNFKTVNNLKPYQQQKYVVISVRSRVLNILEKEKEQKANVPYDDEVYFGGEQYEKIDMSVWEDSISRLNKTDKDILYLVSVQGMDYKDVAAALGISYAAAKQRFWAAKNNLRKILLEGENKK